MQSPVPSLRSIVGYTYDAAAYHPECFPSEVDPVDEEVTPVFEWEQDACDLTCDVCFQPLLECESPQWEGPSPRRA